MNDILDNLFYKEKLGIGNKTTFIKKVRERHPEIKVKDIQDYLKNQEVNQINTSVNKTYQSLEWVLVDYVNVVVHVFQREPRKFYQLEEMWSDSVREEHIDEKPPARNSESKKLVK